MQNILLTAGLLLMLAVVVTRLLNYYWEYDKWLFAFGAALTLAERFSERYSGNNLRIGRLYRMGKISAILYCVAAYFIVSPTGKLRDCLAFLTAGAVLQLYTSFVYDREKKKEVENEKETTTKRKKQ